MLRRVPDIAEIEAAIPDGRQPYILLDSQLAEDGVMRGMGHPEHALLKRGIGAFALADRNKIPRPPLSVELSELLQAFDSVPLITYRDRTVDDDFRTGDSPVLVFSHIEAARLLLFAIADHGNGFGLGNGNG